MFVNYIKLNYVAVFGYVLSVLLSIMLHWSCCVLGVPYSCKKKLLRVFQTPVELLLTVFPESSCSMVHIRGGSTGEATMAMAISLF